jgi:ribosomal protein S5
MNIVKGVFNGLESLFNAKKVAEGRGKKLEEFWG